MTYTKTIVRRKSNGVLMLRNNIGDWLEIKNEISEIVLNFFKMLFSKEIVMHTPLETAIRF